MTQERYDHIKPEMDRVIGLFRGEIENLDKSRVIDQAYCRAAEAWIIPMMEWVVEEIRLASEDGAFHDHGSAMATGISLATMQGVCALVGSKAAVDMYPIFAQRLIGEIEIQYSYLCRDHCPK